MTFVAHEDDSILFLSPDLLHDIQGGRCERTVFLTGGDAGGDLNYVSSREQGAEAAYAEMAGVPDTWTQSDAGISGHPMSLMTLAGDPSVSLIFMRLPDGNGDGSGFAAYGNLSLQQLYTGAIKEITAEDNSSSYNKSQLVSTLTTMMRSFAPDRIDTQDFSGSGNFDHSDHIYTAYLTRDASRAYTTAPHTLVGYLDYTSENQSSNVSGTDLTQKQNAFFAYAPYDGVCKTVTTCQSTSEGAWLSRQYTVGSEQDGPGVSYPPTASAGLADQTVTFGSTVQLDGSGSADPNGNPSYQWTQTAGPAVSLSSTTAVKPTFTAPTSAATLTFQLVVSDGTLSSAPATVTITVTSPEGPNIAPLATVTASSASPGQPATAAVDGVIDGFPTNPGAEWATAGGGAGSWLNLAWSSPHTINRVVLYDRPNTNDQVTGGTLTFSDGSSLSVPALANIGTGVAVNFPSVTTTSVLFTITSVSASTSNVGLAEIQVQGPQPSGAPTVTAVTAASPSSSGQGTTEQNVTITGSGFQSGATVSFANAGIMVNSTTYVSSSQVTANITIAPSAPAGSTDVTVTNPDLSAATGGGIFTVNGTLTASAGANQAVTYGSTVQLDGSGSVDPYGNPSYQWTQTRGPAVNLSSTTAARPTFTAPNSDATLTFQLVVSDGTHSSAPATVTITVTAPEGPNIAPVATVTASSQNPDTGQLAIKAVDGVIDGCCSGDYTKEWATVGGGAGSWLNLVWSSPQTINRVVLYDRPNVNDQVTGGTLTFSDGSSVPVPALNNDGSATTVNFPAITTTSVLFTITSVSASTFNVGLAEIQVFGSVPGAGGPTVTAASPSSGGQGASGENVTISGSGFQSGATVSFANAGITVNSTTYVSSSQLTANITIAPSAGPGATDVTVNNADSSAATGGGIFSVNAAPTVGSASPAGLPQGAPSQNVTINGTGFAGGASVAFSGTGIAVKSTSFVSSTQLTANVTIAASAATGGRGVTVTNSDGSSGSAQGIFTVTAPPFVISASPTALAQGATSQNVTINGTGFASGATAAFSGTGITVNSTSFVSSTQLTANVTIAGSAPTGAGNVTVANLDGGSGTGTGVFAVTAAPPAVTGASPSSGGQGASGENVTISGSGFQSGATVSFANAGITVNSTTNVSSSQLTANITIAPSAATGATDVTVANPDFSGATGMAIFIVDAGPVVGSASPNALPQGAASQNVTISGTGFAGRASVAFSGTGITVNSTSFVSSTQLTASVTIAGSAAPGARDVTVTNADGGSGTGAGVFSVTSGPAVTSATPNALAQSATGQNVTITGTGFASGASVAFSGTGITVNSTSFVSSTQLTANITLAASAPTGGRNVTVTNPDGGSGTGTGVFAVTAAPPAVTGASPSSGGQGASGENVTISGSGFQSGATVSFADAGITVNSTTYVSSSQVTANITIAPAAAPGATDVTVTNADSSAATGAGMFIVNAAPTVSSASPNALADGATSQNVTITGTGFASGATAAFAGTGITVNSTSFVSSTQLTASVTIAASAATGARDVTVTNADGGSGKGTGVFSVISAPAMTSASPNALTQGATSQNVTISGTGFASGATVAFSGAGITVNSTSFVSSTQLTANVTIAASAPTGVGNVTVTNLDGGSGTANGAFSVTVPAPVVTGASPSSRGQGASGQNITIAGSGFQSGATVSFANTGITVNSTTYVSSSQLTANITIASSAATGKTNATVTNPDSSTATGAGIFTVNAAPTVSSTSPIARGQGATSQNVTITGTGFVSGATAAFSGTGVTVTSTSFVSSTRLTATVTIAASAATGARDVTVTNADGGSGKGTGVFSVTPGPAVTSATPNAMGQGATSQNVTINGTGFASGAKVAFSGTGITVNFTSFVTSTQLTANVTVATSATTGARNVTVTNSDAGAGTGTSVFSVTSAPAVTSASPNALAQGAPTQNVTINGTGFASGASVSFSGTGITVNSASVVSSTQLTVNVTVATAAATGSRIVTVTNGDGGVGKLANAFTVRAAPMVTSISPTSADIGATSYSVAITGSGFVSGAMAAFGPNVTVNSTTFNNATKVTANITIPTGASTGATNVTVTNPDGSSASGAGLFTVNGAPTITSPSTAQPQRVTHSTKATVAIAGTNFESGAKVTISGGFGTPSVTFVSATQLSATVTASTAKGTYNLTVTNPDGTKVVSIGAMVNQ